MQMCDCLWLVTIVNPVITYTSESITICMHNQFHVFKHIFSPVIGARQTLFARCWHWKQEQKKHTVDLEQWARVE